METWRCIMDRSCNTYYAKIYMAGDVDLAANECRAYCDKVGLCVRIYESYYIYTGGSESGFCIQLINYPKYQCDEYDVLIKAVILAKRLLEVLDQNSYSIETPRKTYWHDKREMVPGVE